MGISGPPRHRRPQTTDKGALDEGGRGPPPPHFFSGRGGGRGSGPPFGKGAPDLPVPSPRAIPCPAWPQLPSPVRCIACAAALGDRRSLQWHVRLAPSAGSGPGRGAWVDPGGESDGRSFGLARLPLPTQTVAAAGHPPTDFRIKSRRQEAAGAALTPPCGARCPPPCLWLCTVALFPSSGAPLPSSRSTAHRPISPRCHLLLCHVEWPYPSPPPRCGKQLFCNQSGTGPPSQSQLTV